MIMVLIFRHSVGTPPGLVTDFLTEARLPQQTFFWGQDSIQELQKISPEKVRWLIVLGGPQNVDETEKYPWLKDEKRWIENYLRGPGQYTGLCLGGQLLAEALGARVGKHTEYEMGWHEVQLSPQASPLVAHSPAKMTVFEYHGYSFDTPTNCRSFATNKTTQHQGFVYADRAIGLQFHPEATAEWVQHCAREKDFPQNSAGLAVQDPAMMIADIPRFLPSQKDWFWKLLDQQRALLTPSRGFAKLNE